MVNTATSPIQTAISSQLQQAWESLLGESFGVHIQLQLSLLANLPREKLLGAIEKAIDGIGTAEALGPMVDPSKWQDGRLFKSAREYSEVLNRLRALVLVLPESMEPPV